jgi:hypothetical protein
MQNQQNQQNQRPTFLFFSPKCSHSMQLINLIQQNSELSKTIKPVNIHLAKDLPTGLKSVPTILYNGQFLIGSESFKWVHFMISLQNQNQNQNNQNQNNQMQNNQMQNNQMQNNQMQNNQMQNNQESGYGQQQTNQNQDQNQQNEIVPMDICSVGGKCNISYDILESDKPFEKSYKNTNFSSVEKTPEKYSSTGIDMRAANDQSMANRPKDKGMSEQYEQLQKLRGNVF